ncbi:unnamed protein product [Dicrocoelium dendriticum]|nr:unnamed protein product [Dicrocoelium dendriticum]
MGLGLAVHFVRNQTKSVMLFRFCTLPRVRREHSGWNILLQQSAPYYGSYILKTASTINVFGIVYLVQEKQVNRSAPLSQASGSDGWATCCACQHTDSRDVHCLRAGGAVGRGGGEAKRWLGREK